MKKSVADMPEMKILRAIFEGKGRDVNTLLRIRNKVCDSNLFTDDESLELSDLILDIAQEEGAITWDEELGEYVRNEDGLPIALV